jgi:hypothetical protein
MEKIVIKILAEKAYRGFYEFLCKKNPYPIDLIPFKELSQNEQEAWMEVVCELFNSYPLTELDCGDLGK